MTTTPFVGFPAGRLAVVAIPDLFVSQLLEQIDDLVELKATLAVFWYVQRKRNAPKLATWQELSAETGIAHLLAPGEAGRAALRDGISRAVARGTLLQARVEIAGQPDDVYLVNSPLGRRTLEQLRRGDLDFEHVVIDVTPAGRPSAQRSSIFALYEQNIGLLTPLVAEELAETARRYPLEWIEDGIREAVAYNRRSWRYVRRILERWEQEGRSDETDRRRHGARATGWPRAPRR